jgi:hypothetical protein
MSLLSLGVAAVDLDEGWVGAAELLPSADNVTINKAVEVGRDAAFEF